ncbi:MAG TPA: hypothetical protein VNF02_01530 [Candidatus Limnocylindrales bacterium]|nr:hypothetical protein [Candidatus Limnocylindrales bacterium]
MQIRCLPATAGKQQAGSSHLLAGMTTPCILQRSDRWRRAHLCYNARFVCAAVLAWARLT